MLNAVVFHIYIGCAVCQSWILQMCYEDWDALFCVHDCCSSEWITASGYYVASYWCTSYTVRCVENLTIIQLLFNRFRAIVPFSVKFFSYSLMVD